MKKYILLLFLILIFTQNAFCQSQQVKVMSYNIWNGFEWGHDTERKEKLLAWMKEQNLDVIALQELCGYTPEKLAADSKTWGHEYSILFKEDGYSVGLTSNAPIELKEKIREGMHHGALHCATLGIDFFVVHFSPRSYLKRREETKIILDKIEAIKSSNTNYLALGDFNAVSPMDADFYPSDGALLKRMKERNADKPIKGNLFNGNLDYAVISSFLAFPMIDISQSFTCGINERVSFPTRVFFNAEKEKLEDYLGQSKRIDFILASPELAKKCLISKVMNEEATYFLSDHYPVFAVFQMD